MSAARPVVTLRNLMGPCFMASATTAVGYASLSTATLQSVNMLRSLFMDPYQFGEGRMKLVLGAYGLAGAVLIGHNDISIISAVMVEPARFESACMHNLF